MPCEAELTLRYGSRKTAEAVGESVAVDDDRFVAVTVSGRDVVIRVRARDARSLMRALDDVLACVSTAEKSLECLAALSSSERR